MAPPRTTTQGSTSGQRAFPRRFPREEVTIPKKLFVGNLSFDATQTDVEILFSEVGDLGEVFLPADRNTGRPRGFAFVEFLNEDEATEAIEKFDGYQFKGRALRVNEATEKPRRAPGMGGGFGGPPPGGGFGGGGGGGYDRPKPKGSRRNVRGKKRSL